MQSISDTFAELKCIQEKFKVAIIFEGEIEKKKEFAMYPLIWIKFLCYDDNLDDVEYY